MAKDPVLYRRESEFNSALSRAEQFKTQGNRILKQHIAYGSPFPLTATKQLAQIMQGRHTAGNAYKSLLIDTLTPPEVLPGISMKKEVMLESLDLPDYSELNTICESAGDVWLHDELCTMKGQEVVINEAAVAAKKEALTIYADTSIKRDILSAHIKAAEALDTLSKLLAKVGNAAIASHLGYDLIFSIDPVAGSVKPKFEYYAGAGFIKPQ